jgi:hypothetical protein
MIEWYERTEDGVTTRVPAKQAMDEGREAILDRVTVRAHVRKIDRKAVRKAPGDSERYFQYDITYTDDRRVVLVPLRTTGTPAA